MVTEADLYVVTAYVGPDVIERFLKRNPLVREWIVGMFHDAPSRHLLEYFSARHLRARALELRHPQQQMLVALPRIGGHFELAPYRDEDYRVVEYESYVPNHLTTGNKEEIRVHWRMSDRNTRRSMYV